MSQRVPCANFYEEDPFSWSNLCFEGLFVLGLLINLYLIYCILRRSPKNMSTYKWYLLYHQIVTAMADIGYNFVGKPIIFLPFVAGYPMSVFRGVVPTHLLTVYCQVWTIFSIVTIAHLFWFRYLAVRRVDRPPLHYWIRLSSLYLVSTVIAIFNYWMGPDTEVALEKAEKEYLCVGKYLLQIEGFIMYDWKVVGQIVIPYACTWVFVCMFEISYLIIFSLRETYMPNMSPQLAKLNRKFLIQLIVQGGTPFCIVTIPFAIYLVSVFSGAAALGQGFGRVLVAALASFSMTSGLALIVMTPAYRPKIIQKKLEIIFIKPAASVSSNQSRVA